MHELFSVNHSHHQTFFYLNQHIRFDVDLCCLYDTLIGFSGVYAFNAILVKAVPPGSLQNIGVT